MIVYKCVITGDEMFSDSYPVTDLGSLYEIKAKYVTESNEGIDESKIGGNKSAEEPDETGTEEGSKSGPNVALANNYMETGFGTKKEFLVSMKSYFKAVQTYHEEKEGDSFDLTAFKAEVEDAMKKTIVPIFKDLTFYTGSSLNPDGAMPMLLWKKDDAGEDIPYFYYFKCGLIKEKY